MPIARMPYKATCLANRSIVLVDKKLGVAKLKNTNRTASTIKVRPLSSVMASEVFLSFLLNCNSSIALTILCSGALTCRVLCLCLLGYRVALITCQDQLIFRQIVTQNLGGLQTVAKDDNAVGESHDLFQLGTDDHDAEARIRIAVDDFKNFRLGADVDAAAGFVQKQNLRMSQEALADDHLLLVAAGQGQDGQAFVRHLDMDGINLFFYRRILGLIIQKHFLGVI